MGCCQTAGHTGWVAALALDQVPAHRLTHAQAGVLLGIRELSVSRLVWKARPRPVARHAKAGLLRADVEAYSLGRWRLGDPTWLIAAQVAKVLGVSGPRVHQLTAAGKLPYEAAPDGRQLYRPGQVAVIANARRVRFHAGGRKSQLASSCGSGRTSHVSESSPR